MIRHFYVIRNENLYWNVNELSCASSQQGVRYLPWNCMDVGMVVIYSIKGSEISNMRFVVVTNVYTSS